RSGPELSRGTISEFSSSSRKSIACWLIFFQGEGGIRDKLVTGVQTCALPIYLDEVSGAARAGVQVALLGAGITTPAPDRKSVVEGKSGDLGWRPIIKNKS